MHEEPEIKNILQKFISEWEISSSLDIYWIMRHQLIVACRDRQGARRDLALLISDGILRQLTLPLDSQEKLIIYSHDFERIAMCALERRASEKTREFFSYLYTSGYGSVDGYLSTCHLQDSLKKLTSQQSFHEQWTSNINELKQSGLMSFDIKSACYIWSLPGIGRFLQNLRLGRYALLNLFKKKVPQTIITSTFRDESISPSDFVSRYHMFYKSKSPLSLHYLLYDALGTGLILP